MLNWIERTRGMRTLALMGLMAPALAAQSLSLPGSDPVSIGRAGAGVAYGRSLEAAGLNPALLTTLTDPKSAFLGLGEEFQSSQFSLQSNQKTVYSTDRNRVVPSLGTAWRLGDRNVLGFRVDVPFLRHSQFSEESSARFVGDELSLKTLRAEVQLARSFGHDGQFSFGVSAGMVKVDLVQGTVVRALVGATATLPVSGGNPSLGLVETRVTQQGTATMGTLAMGFRWALNPRWTLGGSAQGYLKAAPSMTAAWGDRPSSTVANDGFSTAPLGLNSSALLGASNPVAGTGTLALPKSATVGIRQRVNNFFTWEADLRYLRMRNLALPGMPALKTPSGTVGNGASVGALKDSMGLLVAGEAFLSSRWTLRGGFGLEKGFREDGDVEPLLGGAPTSNFSIGAGFKTWGGEWNFGYQVRLNRDQESSKLDGTWSSTGYRSTGTLARVEGMGHLFSIGFKKAF